MSTSNTSRGQVVDYVRVSSEEQNLERQLEAIGTVDRLYEEKRSGKNIHERPQFTELLAYVRAGDTMRVKSPDRSARSTVDLLSTAKMLTEKGVALEVTDFPAPSTNTPHGEFMLTILERQAKGIAIVKKKGKYERGPTLTATQIASARDRVGLGVPKAVVARELGISRQTLQTALSGQGVYALEGCEMR